MSRANLLLAIDSLYDELFACPFVNDSIVASAKEQIDALPEESNVEILEQATALLLSVKLWIESFIEGNDIPVLLFMKMEVSADENLVPKFGGAYLKSREKVKLFFRQQVVPDYCRRLSLILWYLAFAFSLLELSRDKGKLWESGVQYSHFSHILHPKAMDMVRQIAG